MVGTTATMGHLLADYRTRYCYWIGRLRRVENLEGHKCSSQRNEKSADSADGTRR